MLRIHFLAADQEFCIGMHWAGDPYLINFIWHTQTSTFITMSDFPMLVQFKATASPFLFFEERVIFSNRMSQGYITMSTFICGSLIQRNVYYIFKKAHSLTNPTILPQMLPKQCSKGKRISGTFLLFVGCNFFFSRLENIWVLVLVFSNLYMKCNEFCSISGDFVPSECFVQGLIAEDMYLKWKQCVRFLQHCCDELAALGNSGLWQHCLHCPSAGAEGGNIWKLDWYESFAGVLCGNQEMSQTRFLTQWLNCSLFLCLSVIFSLA